MKQTKETKETKGKWDSILWVEARGFSAMIALSWLAELTRLPHFIFGEPFMPNWERAFLRTVVISLIWLWVHSITRQLLKRLHYLEEFLRVCAWCRRVCHDEKWITMEDYFKSNFSTRTTHGVCPDCLKFEIKEVKAEENPPTDTE
jgi:hypothetical protein